MAATSVDTTGAATLDLSIVVPVYNEEDNVPVLCGAIADALVNTGWSYELLLVDDGSTDSTFIRAQAAASGDPRVQVIRLRQNFGQTTAMAAGIDYARGELVVTMDGDLQNDPRDIPELVAKLREGYDIVVGWRERRQDHLLTRKLPSRAANWLIAKCTGIKVHDNGCSLKCYRTALIKNTPLYSDLHRFIPAMASLFGARLAEIKVRHHARRFGRSKYSLSRVYKVLFDLITVTVLITALKRPVAWAAAIGLASMIISGAALAWSIRVAIETPEAPLIVMASISMLFAALALFSGLMGLLAEAVFITGATDRSRLPNPTADVIEPNGYCRRGT